MVVIVLRSLSVIDPQLHSVREPMAVTGARLGCRSAALRGAIWLYRTLDRHPTKPIEFALEISGSISGLSVDNNTE